MQFQRSYAHSLTSALHYLVPVRPRRQIVYPLEKLGINAPSKAVSKDLVGSPAAAGRGRGASSRGRGRWAGSAVFPRAGRSLITGAWRPCPCRVPCGGSSAALTSGGCFTVASGDESTDPLGTPLPAAVSQDNWPGVRLLEYFWLFSSLAQKQIPPFRQVLFSRQRGHSQFGQSERRATSWLPLRCWVGVLTRICSLLWAIRTANRSRSAAPADSSSDLKMNRSGKLRARNRTRNRNKTVHFRGGVRGRGHTGSAA